MINKLISVDDGKENKIGIVTGNPVVEIDIDGTVIVGETKVLEEEELITWIVVGRIFLKYVFTSD